MKMKPECLVLLLYLAVLPVDALLCEYAVIIISSEKVLFLLLWFLFVCLYVCLSVLST